MTSEEFLMRFAAFVTEEFGERCADFDPTCSTCRLWGCYDEAERAINFKPPPLSYKDVRGILKS